MKTLRYALLLLMMVLSYAAQAQDDTSSTGIDVDTVIEVVRADYGADVNILEIDLNFDDDRDDDAVDETTGCWDVIIINPDGMADDLTLDLLVCRDDGDNISIMLDEDTADDADDMDDEDFREEDDLSGFTLPAITIEEAIAAALVIYPDGIVSSVELELEDGILIWDIDLEDDTRSVDINAETGTVVEFGYADDDRNDDDRNDDDRDDDDRDDDDRDDDDRDDDDRNDDDRNDDDDHDDDDDDNDDDDDDRNDDDDDDDDDD